MKHFLTLFLIVCSVEVQAQTVLKITATDKMTQNAVQHASVTALSGDHFGKVVFTGRHGYTYITVPSDDTVEVRCEHIAYGAETRTLLPKDLKRDTVKLTIFMRFDRVTTFEEFVVKPAGVPDTVFESERISVDDFEFLPDGRMLLLTYAKNKRRGTEVYLFDGFDVQSRIQLGNDEDGLELIRDYRGNPHVITEKNVYGVAANGNKIAVGGLEKKYFMTYIAPIVDTTITKYFFSNYNPDYPAFDYFTYDLVDSSYRKIAQVEDELMMELYRSEYKWVDVRTKLWAKEMENETGIDAEIWVGANYFTQSIYYKELYAPLFKKNDTIYLFDHYKSLMFRYDAFGNVKDSVPIFYHLQPKQSGWKTQLIQDQKTGQIYSVFEKAGQYSLQRIDLATGEAKESIPLHFKYPENILLRGNSVYYTYRPFESPQKKFLYMEKLPVKHPEVVMEEDDLVKHAE